LALLTPEIDEAQINPRFALARVRARITALERRSAANERTLFQRLSAISFGRVRRSLWLGAVVATLVLVLALTNLWGSRTWAQQVLGLLRIEHVAPAPVTNDHFSPQQYDMLGGGLARLLSDDIRVTKDPGPLRAAASAGQAGALAGFNVRLPENSSLAPVLSVEGESGYRMKLNLVRLQSIVNNAGRPDIQLPPEIDGAAIDINIPKAVFAAYGECPPSGPELNPISSDFSNCIALIELTPPVVLTPSNLNLPELAVIGLQVGGMSKDNAEAFTKTVDWTSMLVIPVPEHLATYQTVQVDGVQGVMINQNVGRGAPAAFALLWFKDGIDYWVVGRGDSSRAISIANSLPQ
ncbi:MAG TPA: hypothetical protein VI756_03185, partial [Blastocatellia bacterium]